MLIIIIQFFFNRSYIHPCRYTFWVGTNIINIQQFSLRLTIYTDICYLKQFDLLCYNIELLNNRKLAYVYGNCICQMEMAL